MIEASSDLIRVFYVDDESDFAEMAAEFIRRQDERFEVETVTSASEALEWLRENTVHCIVSDFDMPGQNGIEFLEAVRTENPDLPFILYTGKGSEEVASEAISAGVTDYLQKGTGSSQYEVLANRIKNAVNQFRTKRELERNQGLLEHTEQLANVGGWEVDVGVGELRWTPGTYAIHDIPPDSEFDPTVETGVAFYHPDDQDEIERLVERCVNLGEGYDVELRLVTADDRLSWVRTTGMAIRKDGGIVTARGAIRDITESKQREQELQEKQAELRKYELTVEKSIDLLAACDTDYDLLFANEQYLDYHGIGPNDISQASLPELLGDEWEQTVRAHVDRALKGEIVQYEMERPRSNGDVRTLDIRYYPLREDDGSVIGAVAAMRDLTTVWDERREREKIIERVTDAIVEVDANWRFTLVNEQAEDLYEMSEEYLLGRDIWDVFTEARGTRFEEEYRSAMATREPTSFVEYFSQLDGWFDIKAYPKDDGGLAFYFIEVTDEREHQHELQQMKERLDLALSVTHTAIWEWDLETDEVTWDETLERAVGLDPGAFEGTLEAFERRIHPDDRPDVEKVLEQAMDNDEMYDTQFRMSHEDGGFSWADVRGRVVNGEDESNRMVGVHHDVTEQKERERQLRRQQSFIEESLDAIQEIFFIVNEDGDLIRVNARAPEITGHSDEKIREMEPPEFFVEEHRDRIQNSFREVFETGSSTVQADMVTKEGEHIPFEFTGVRLQDPMSEGVVACGIGRNISEQVERERELREQAKRFQSVLDSVEAAIWIRDIESRFVLVNENFRNLFDIDTSVEIEGRSPSDILPDELAEQFRENDRRVIDQEERIEIEEAVETAAGKRTFLTRITPLYDGEALFSTCGVATDITDLKQTQEELARINEQLDEVVSIVSHDLRNPLNVASGRLELVQEEYDSEHLEAINRAHERIEALIEDLLTLAREGKRVGETETIALKDLVNDCWGVIETGEATLDIETDQIVRADASRLQQLLENLVRNAIEHGGSGVTVTVGDLEAGFFVEDTGPGIPPTDRDDVFDAGFTTSSGGTGFGLNIVKQIADAHGWNVQVTEADGGGARFQITGVLTE